MAGLDIADFRQGNAGGAELGDDLLVKAGAGLFLTVRSSSAPCCGGELKTLARCGGDPPEINTP